MNPTTNKKSVIVTLKWGYIGRRLDAYQDAIEDINEMRDNEEESANGTD